MPVIETTTNQYGIEETSYEIYTVNGMWFSTILTCLSSGHYSLGTCRCISHNPTETTQITREEAIKELGKNISKLPEEEREDLLNPSLEQRIEEVLSLRGFTLEETEKWCADCYNMDTNPLPKLREHLQGVCEVAFMYDQQEAGYASDTNTLVCKLYQTENPKDIDVTLMVVEGE